MDKKEQNELKEIVQEAVKEGLKGNEFKESVREIVREETKHLATREEMFALFDRHAEMIQGEFKKIHKRFDALESRVAKLEDRVTVLENRMGIVSQQINNLTDAIAELRVERKRDAAYTLELEEKILAERAETQNEYQTLTAKLNELEARISKLEGKSNE
jgi:polyhydroxyalkanoate synthesis regulator phasin